VTNMSGMSVTIDVHHHILPDFFWFARGMGEIGVELTCAGAFFECRVMDNGSSAASVRRGRGLKIINDLTNGLGDGSSRALDRRVRCSWSPSPPVHLHSVMTRGASTGMAAIAERNLKQVHRRWDAVPAYTRTSQGQRRLPEAPDGQKHIRGVGRYSHPVRRLSQQENLFSSIDEADAWRAGGNSEYTQATLSETEEIDG
jgi:hypothetical protein